MFGTSYFNQPRAQGNKGGDTREKLVTHRIIKDTEEEDD